MSRPEIKSYRQADRFLGNAESLSTGQRGTRVVRESATVITVWYHQTPVVTFFKPDTRKWVAKLDTAGWKTPTTISRINEYAPEGVEIYVAGEDEEGYPEAVFLRDETNGVEHHPLSNRPYYMGLATPARSAT